MAFCIVTGSRLVNQRLKELGGKGAQRASASALRAGATILKKQATKDAPVGKNTKERQKKDPSKRLKLTVKVKPAKEGGKVVSLKVTVGAPHGHFVTIGVLPRHGGRQGIHSLNGRANARTDGSTARKKIGGFLAFKGDPALDKRNKRTGRQRANPFFRRAIRTTESQVKTVILFKLRERIRAEWAKT